MTTKTAIENFLLTRRVAFIGVSRDDKHFSRVLWKEFRQRGYETVPVNPAAHDIEGVRCVRSIGDIVPKVDAAIVLTPPGRAADAVEECARAGVQRIWLYRAVGTGTATPEAVAAARSHHLETVEGECPMMWLEDTAWFHGLHKAMRGWFGQLPR